MEWCEGKIAALLQTLDVDQFFS